MVFPPTPDFPRFIADLARAIGKREIPFMLIGGQAVLLHGRPRLTEDIDVTLGVDPGRLDTVLDICRELDLEPLPEDVRVFVRDTFVLPAAHQEGAIRVDFVFSTTSYERQAIGRAVFVEMNGIQVPFATAEDLILHKLFAGRARDWEDAVVVARRQAGALDWSYIERWANEFAAIPGREPMPEDVARLREEAAGE